MGFAKLREWVGTVTGKGDRWGRDSLGRSEPAFLRASTTALPPPTCTARREVQDVVSRCCLLQGRPTVAVCLRPEPGGASAGCVRLQYLFCRLCACCHSLPAMPTALISSCPSSFCFAPFILLLLAPVQCSFCFAPFICLLAPVHVHVRQDHRLSPNMFASCKTVPLAAATRACSGGPCAGPFVDSFSFFLQSP